MRMLLSSSTWLMIDEEGEVARERVGGNLSSTWKQGSRP